MRNATDDHRKNNESNERDHRQRRNYLWSTATDTWKKKTYSHINLWARLMRKPLINPSIRDVNIAIVSWYKRWWFCDINDVNINNTITVHTTAYDMPLNYNIIIIIIQLNVSNKSNLISEDFRSLLYTDVKHRDNYTS